MLLLGFIAQVEALSHKGLIENVVLVIINEVWDIY